MPCVYDHVPGSWGRQSEGWPHLEDADGALRRLVIANKLVPYGSYVTVGNHLRLETQEFIDKVRAAASPQAAPVHVEGEGPDKLRSVVSAIEDEVAAGRHTAASVFTKMRQLIATQPPSQPAADWSAALEKATDRIVASRAERTAVELEEFRRPVEAWIARATEGMRSHMHPASEQERESYEAAASDFEQGTRLLALIDGAKAGRVDHG